MRPRKWTETTIKQAFDDFIEQYDRLPTRQEMYGKYNKSFPRPLSIKLTLGMTIGEYLQLNYIKYLHRCQSKNYGNMTKEYWMDDFKEQYIKYNFPTENEYNRLRNPQTPNTQTLAKIIGVVTWREVLESCGFKKKEIELCGELVFEETLENYQALSNKLQNLIKNFK